MSSVQGLVNGLCAAGFLLEDDRRYLLGPAPDLLNRLAGRPLTDFVSQADLEALARRTSTVVTVAMRMGDAAVYIDSAGPIPPKLSFVAETLPRRSLLTTAPGKVLLAYSDDRDLRADLASAARTDPTAVDEFLEEIQTIRTRGLAYTPHHPIDPDVATLSTPLHRRGQPVAALSLMGPADRFEAKTAELGRILIRASRRWTARTESA